MNIYIQISPCLREEAKFQTKAFLTEYYSINNKPKISIINYFEI